MVGWLVTMAGGRFSTLVVWRVADGTLIQKVKGRTDCAPSVELVWLVGWLASWRAVRVMTVHAWWWASLCLWSFVLHGCTSWRARSLTHAHTSTPLPPLLRVVRTFSALKLFFLPTHSHSRDCTPSLHRWSRARAGLWSRPAMTARPACGT